MPAENSRKLQVGTLSVDSSHTQAMKLVLNDAHSSALASVSIHLLSVSRHLRTPG